MVISSRQPLLQEAQQLPSLPLIKAMHKRTLMAALQLHIRLPHPPRLINRHLLRVVHQHILILVKQQMEVLHSMVNPHPRPHLVRQQDLEEDTVNQAPLRESPLLISTNSSNKLIPR